MAANTSSVAFTADLTNASVALLSHEAIERLEQLDALLVDDSSLWLSNKTTITDSAIQSKRVCEIALDEEASEAQIYLESMQAHQRKLESLQNSANSNLASLLALRDDKDDMLSRVHLATQGCSDVWSAQSQKRAFIDAAKEAISRLEAIDTAIELMVTHKHDPTLQDVFKTLQLCQQGREFASTTQSNKGIQSKIARLQQAESWALDMLQKISSLKMRSSISSSSGDDTSELVPSASQLVAILRECVINLFQESQQWGFFVAMSDGEVKATSQGNLSDAIYQSIASAYGVCRSEVEENISSNQTAQRPLQDAANSKELGSWVSGKLRQITEAVDEEFSLVQKLRHSFQVAVPEDFAVQSLVPIAQGFCDKLQAVILSSSDLWALCDAGEAFLSYELVSRDKDTKFGRVSSVLQQSLQQLEGRLTYLVSRFINEQLLSLPSDTALDYPKILETKTQALVLQGGSSASSMNEEQHTVAPENNATEEEVSQGQEEVVFPPVMLALRLLTRLERACHPNLFSSICGDVLMTARQTVVVGRVSVAARSGQQHGDLFSIRSLLLLRKQVSGFSSPFTVTDTEMKFPEFSSIFSNWLGKRGPLFRWGADNGILQLWQQMTPKVSTVSKDARLLVESDIREAVESFISSASHAVTSPLVNTVAAYEDSGNDANASEGNRMCVPPAAATSGLEAAKEALDKAQQKFLNPVSLYIDSAVTRNALLRPIKARAIESLETFEGAIQLNNQQENITADIGSLRKQYSQIA